MQASADYPAIAIMPLAPSHQTWIATVYLGATIADAQAAGFNELTLPAREMVTRGESPLRVFGPVLRAECAALFAEWLRRPDAKPY